MPFQCCVPFWFILFTLLSHGVQTGKSRYCEYAYIKVRTSLLLAKECTDFRATKCICIQSASRSDLYQELLRLKVYSFALFGLKLARLASSIWKPNLLFSFFASIVHQDFIYHKITRIKKSCLPWAKRLFLYLRSWQVDTESFISAFCMCFNMSFMLVKASI